MQKNVLHRWNESRRLLLVQLSQIPAYRPISISTLYTANQWRNVTVCVFRSNGSIDKLLRRVKISGEQRNPACILNARSFC